MKQKKEMSLRLKIAMLSIMTLCASCVISCLIVILTGFIFTHGPIPNWLPMVMCLGACVLCMLIGGLTLWHVSLSITKPILRLSDAVKQVALGNFTIQMERKAHKYHDEIDELSQNFNKMSNELLGMDYMRKDFMSSISHEIKTPVAAITGFSEILLNDGLTDGEQREYLAYINKESLRLSRLCDNMLRMSKLDFQTIVDKNKLVSVDEQLRKCIIMICEKWSDKEINFELDLQPCSLYSDADLLMQVWTNLIDNAVKFSHQGGSIWISAVMQGTSVCVEIRDEGVGIPEEKRKWIFDKFYQVDASHKDQGYGLGLSIVKRILELLNGEINCMSHENEGTVMRVII